MLFSLILALLKKYELRHRHLLVFLCSGLFVFLHLLADPAFAWYVD
jgi:hypothetical protein